MRHRTTVVLLLGLAFAVTSLVIAQDQGSADTEKQPERPRVRARLVKPWSELSTLSADQKEQIIRIHAEALQAMRKAREKEESEIMALLTPENKTELEALRARQRAEAKARQSRQVQEPESDAPAAPADAAADHGQAKDD